MARRSMPLLPRIGRLLRVAKQRFFPDLRVVAHDETAQLPAVGALVGALAGLAAGALDRLIALVSEFTLGTTAPSLDGVVPWLAFFGPVLGGLVSGLLIRWASRTWHAQGIPDIIDATWNRQGHVSLREATVSSLAAAAVVGGGQSGGREGPIAQLAAAVASHVSRRLGLPPGRMRVLVAAGAAAGIAASFNTPIGAAFFAMEVVLGNFAMAMFAPVVAATVAGTVVGQALLGDRVALSLPAFELGHPAELALFLVLGALAGGVAVAFKRAHRAAGRFAAKVPLWLRPAAAGVVVGVIAAGGLPQVMGNGYAFLQAGLRGEVQLGVGMLVLLFVAKGVATNATLGGGGGAGLFAPTLFLGGVLGLAFGQSVAVLAPDLIGSVGIYGVVGMGAVAAAVTHAPLTLALMVFEMTRNYQVMLPLLLTLAVAGLVTAGFGSESIYLQALRALGIRVDRTREELVMHDLKVKDLMRSEGLPVVALDASMPAVVDRFLTERHEELFVVDADGRLHGLVHIQDVKRILAGGTPGGGLESVETRSLPHLRPEQSLADTLPLFFHADLEELPVVDGDGCLVGSLKERHVMGAYHQEVLRKEAVLARVSSETDAGRQTDFFELPPGQKLRVHVVGGEHAGQNLRELALPRRKGCTVIAIVSRDEKGQERRLPADANRPLREGDRLIMLGPVELPLDEE